MQAYILPEVLAAHAPALLVAIPLFMSALVAAQPSGRAGYLIAVASVAASLALAVELLFQVNATSLVSYALGGWEPPFGIEFRVDALNAALLLLLGVVG